MILIQCVLSSFDDAEATLLKLKQGSRCHVPSMDEESTMEIDADDVAAIPGHVDSSSNSSSLKQSEGKNMSILYFFSKCKSSPHGHGSDGEEPMSGYNSSSSISTTSVDSS